MKKHTILPIVVLCILVSCGTSKKNQAKEEPRMLVTSELLKGNRYGYTEEQANVSFYHMVEFPTDSTGYILMGGDVLEACKYYTKADSVYVTVIHTDPPYTEVFGYKDGTLIDRRGKVWTEQQY